MWAYKVCKKHISKGYTVVARYWEKYAAERSASDFAFYDKNHKYFVKRYSEKEEPF